MNETRILVAEDDTNIRTGLVDTLESEGFQVVEACDGNEAVKAFQNGGFDLLLLDIMMPEKSGYDVCREIRAIDKQVPIIMVTAKSEEIDTVVGLELGADDYVTKPFGVHELLARISAVLRRSRQCAGSEKPDRPETPERFCFGCCEVYPRRYTLVRDGKEIELSPKEMQLICCLRDHPGEVLGRDEILNRVWGVDYYGTTRTLDQHIAKLRKKVEVNPSHPSTIVTVHGVGYRYICQ
ncbi:MAG: response regulator transcription factor [Desulfobacterium sp.]|nr:response regulator transcription factor [Desulfobacterium sp.]